MGLVNGMLFMQPVATGLPYHGPVQVHASKRVLEDLSVLEAVISSELALDVDNPIKYDVGSDVIGDKHIERPVLDGNIRINKIPGHTFKKAADLIAFEQTTGADYRDYLVISGDDNRIGGSAEPLKYPPGLPTIVTKAIINGAQVDMADENFFIHIDDEGVPWIISITAEFQDELLLAGFDDRQQFDAPDIPPTFEPSLTWRFVVRVIKKLSETELLNEILFDELMVLTVPDRINNMLITEHQFSRNRFVVGVDGITQGFAKFRQNNVIISSNRSGTEFIVNVYGVYTLEVDQGDDRVLKLFGFDAPMTIDYRSLKGSPPAHRSGGAQGNLTHAFKISLTSSLGLDGKNKFQFFFDPFKTLPDILTSASIDGFDAFFCYRYDKLDQITPDKLSIVIDRVTSKSDKGADINHELFTVTLSSGSKTQVVDNAIFDDIETFFINTLRRAAIIFQNDTSYLFAMDMPKNDDTSNLQAHAAVVGCADAVVAVNPSIRLSHSIFAGIKKTVVVSGGGGGFDIQRSNGNAFIGITNFKFAADPENETMHFVTDTNDEKRFIQMV